MADSAIQYSRDAAAHEMDEEEYKVSFKLIKTRKEGFQLYKEQMGDGRMHYEAVDVVHCDVSLYSQK